MSPIAAAPPVRWRPESKEIGGFYTFLKSEVDKLKAAEGKMRTHAMKQCNVLLKEYVSFNPYIQGLYFEHQKKKKLGDSRYPQSYRYSVAPQRIPLVWNSSPPPIYRKESVFQAMSESSSYSGYESSEQTKAQILSKTPKPERGRKKSPDSSHNRTDASRNPERENGKNRSPELIWYRSPDANPERPSAGTPYKISEGNPFKYRKAASLFRDDDDHGVGGDSSRASHQQQQQYHRRLQLDHPTFARVVATGDSELVAEVSRFLTPLERGATARSLDLPTRLSNSSSLDQSQFQSPQTPLLHSSKSGENLDSMEYLQPPSNMKSLDSYNLFPSNAGNWASSTSGASTLGLPSSHHGVYTTSSSSTTGAPTTATQSTIAATTATGTRSFPKTFDSVSQGGDTRSQVPRTISSNTATSSSERPGTKLVSFDGLPYQLFEGGISYQDEGTQTYAIPGTHVLQYGIVQGGVPPPPRSDPEFNGAMTTTTTTTMTNNVSSSQQQAIASSSTHSRNQTPSKLPGGGIYTYKVPAGGSYRMPDFSSRLPEAKLAEDSSNVYVISDAAQHKVSESRGLEHVQVGHLLYGSQTRVPEAEKRNRIKNSENALGLKRRKKKVVVHRCNVNDLVPEQRRIKRRSIQNRVPETKKYTFYKYYGFAGKGAKTSWGHNRPLGLSPPHAQRAPPELVKEEQTEEEDRRR